MYTEIKLTRVTIDFNDKESVEKAMQHVSFSVMISSKSLRQMLYEVRDIEKSLHFYHDQQIYLSTGLDMFHFLVSALDNINDNIKNDPKGCNKEISGLAKKFNRSVSTHCEKRNKYTKDRGD
jgi:GTP1/Obg family GTP-binding protein